MDDSVDSKGFGAVDLVVFFGLLALSMLVGIYYAIKDRSKKTTENYYFGERSMSAIPVGLSIAVTYISALTVIGFPTEAYAYGTVTLWYSVSGIYGNLVACVYYVPLIRRLGLSSIFAFLQLRFNAKMRVLESSIIICASVFYFGMAIYLPALALSAVTPLSLNVNIVLTSLVCTVYTALGGMKAVVWTDALQTFIMFGGMTAALVKAIVDVGGFNDFWESLGRGQRLTAINFNLDPTMAYTFWTIMIGQGVGWCSIGTSQPICQRFLACKTTNGARWAAAISLFLTFGFFSLATLSGLAIFAYFEGCDPLKSGQINKPDQLMPYLAVNVFHDMPGMAGLFVSAAFSATLSTVSSGINACGALLLEDFISPRYPSISELTKVTISKGVVIVFGVLVMCFALCVQFFHATIVQISFTIYGAIVGPLLGVFTLGIFLPWANAVGAFVAQLSGTVVVAAIGMTALIKGRSPQKYAFLPTSTDQCDIGGAMATESFGETQTAPLLFTNATQVAASTAQDMVESSPSYVTGLLSISHLYYTLLSLFITIIVGLFVSFLTGANDPKKSDPKLFMPFISNKLLPLKVREFFRFGVPPLLDEDDCKNDDEGGQKVELFSRTSYSSSIDLKEDHC